MNRGASEHCRRSADAHIRQDSPNAEPAGGCGHPRTDCPPEVGGSLQMRPMIGCYGNDDCLACDTGITLAE